MFSLFLEREKVMVVVIMKMKMVNQLGKRNRVIKNVQVELRAMMKKYLKMLKNNYLKMNQMIMQVIVKTNQNENQHQRNQ